MRNKFLISLIAFFASAVLIGTTYSAWINVSDKTQDNIVQIEVPEWSFGDSGFAKIENISDLSYLTATKEETITQGSSEAVRFTNTGGTHARDHIFYVDLDQDYNLYDIATCKIEFDYYHTYKREQNTKGFPKLQLFHDSIGRGTVQGGDDTITEIAPYVVTNIDEDWWHLEYYITSMCPTMADHQDKPQSNYQINRIKFTDRGIYDYADVTGWFVMDNLMLTNEPGARLGLFNRTAGDTKGKFFWFKVAWSGDLHSCVLTTSDSSKAIWDDESTKSPFYVKLLEKGQVTITATLEIGSNHQIFTISNTITIN